jgi:hypothetical protein
MISDNHHFEPGAGAIANILPVLIGYSKPRASEIDKAIY